jgi:hypothetical protein
MKTELDQKACTLLSFSSFSFGVLLGIDAKGRKDSLSVTLSRFVFGSLAGIFYELLGLICVFSSAEIKLFLHPPIRGICG